MSKKSIALYLLAVLLSDAMCAVVAYNYCRMLFGIKYAGYSAPAWLAFLYAIPFMILIVICLVLAVVFNKKRKRDLH